MFYNSRSDPLLSIHHITSIAERSVMAEISESLSTNLNNESSIPRRAANHHGNVWDDDLILSLNSPYGVYFPSLSTFVFCFLFVVSYRSICSLFAFSFLFVGSYQSIIAAISNFFIYIFELH